MNGYRSPPKLKEVAKQIAEQVPVKVHRCPRAPSGKGPHERADAVARDAGLRELGSGWKEISEDEARRGIAHCIGYDLAYSSTSLVDPRQARSLADAVFAHVDPGSRCFTGSAVTDWTLDRCYVLLGTSTALLICFMAED